MRFPVTKNNNFEMIADAWFKTIIYTYAYLLLVIEK